MKHILVPTDFSKTSKMAIDFAIHVAGLIEAKITLLHSFEVAEGNYNDLLGVNSEYVNDLVNEAKIKINDLKLEVKKKTEIEIDAEVSTKILADAINEVALNKKIDLVVMATLGATGLKAKIWGSNTSEVIGKTKIPILAIPSDYQWKKMENILLATKQFERNDAILDYLYELSYLFVATVKTTVFTENNESAAIYVKHQEELQNYEEFLKKEYHDKTLSSVHLIGSNFEETLESYISEHNIDLLAMITYQEGFWKNLFNPSYTKQMSFHTKIPLLVIPAGFQK